MPFAKKMRCPTLKELPLPPSDKRGWPWTEESPQLPDAMPDGSPWPRISIVTPSLNQGQFIEETIRSVLLQGYPDLEYIIIDGGSKDGSVDIIKKYEQWITYWVSETDKGQSHAINKGFCKTSGHVLAYLNSDDIYESHCFDIIAATMKKDSKGRLIAGRCSFFHEDRITNIFEPWWPKSLHYFLNPFGSTFAQPAAFWDSFIYEKVGGFDENLNFCFDREFFLHIRFLGVELTLLPKKIARYREHPATKSYKQLMKFYEESIYILYKWCNYLGLSEEEKKEKLQEIIYEKKYLNIFIYWKTAGRLRAIIHFILFLLEHPRSIYQRKILGLGRRLITFKYENVGELKRF